MANIADLRQAIIDTIKSNGKQEITGDLLQARLLEIVDSLEDGGVIKKGEADNTAVLEGDYQGYRNRAISQTSMAVGAGNIAGLKGWYYSKIDFNTKQITLSDTRTYLAAGVLVNGSWSSGAVSAEVGMVVSIVNNKKYDLCAKITKVSGNVITLDSIPFNSLDSSVSLNPGMDDWSIYIPEYPYLGVIDFGGGAFAEGGLESKASNICAHAEGLGCHAYGQYSHAEGRYTMAGYAAHAEGMTTEARGESSHAEGLRTKTLDSGAHAEGADTIASGQKSHAEGDTCEASGYASHAEGFQTIASGLQTHSEGKGCVASGNNSHAEGSGSKALDQAAHAEGVRTEAGYVAHAEGYETKAVGQYSHAEGFRTEANNNYEHACGKYNASTKSSDAAKATAFSVGGGTDTSKRENLFEIKKNGDLYLKGIEGSLQSYLSRQFVHLSGDIPLGNNVTQKELDAIGLTAEVLQDMVAGVCIGVKVFRDNYFVKDAADDAEGIEITLEGRRKYVIDQEYALESHNFEITVK